MTHLIFIPMSGIADKHKNIAVVSESAGIATAKCFDAMSL
jgi:hypothetical protein